MVLYLYYGGTMQKIKTLIDSEKHHILESVHPSPLSFIVDFLEIIISKNK